MCAGGAPDPSGRWAGAGHGRGRQRGRAKVERCRWTLLTEVDGATLLLSQLLSLRPQ